MSLLKRGKQILRTWPSSPGLVRTANPPNHPEMSAGVSSAPFPSLPGPPASDSLKPRLELRTRPLSQNHHHPSFHVHRHPGFLELNSPCIEALTECSINSIEELRSLLDSNSPEMVPVLDRIIDQGFTELPLVIDLLQNAEASERLLRFRELSILAHRSELLVIFPLPPHITNRLAKHIYNGLLLTASDHLPPHLHGWSCEHIDSIIPDHLLARVGSIKAIAVAGKCQNRELWVPTNVVRFLYIIESSHSNLKLFIHDLPHVPLHLEMTKVSISYQVYTI